LTVPLGDEMTMLMMSFAAPVFAAVHVVFVFVAPETEIAEHDVTDVEPILMLAVNDPPPLTAVLTDVIV